MGLVKRTYVDGETVITADNLNDIQDEIIQNASDISTKGTYSKPSGGIPSTDLSSAVQTSLGKADTALQSSDIDNTLTASGKAADAKKTGDEISDVRNTLNQFNTDTFGNISLSGTNTTGSTITTGTFFYNNGLLTRATSNIQSGSDINIGSNAEIITAGGLNSLNSSFRSLMKLSSNLTTSGLTFTNCTRENGGICMVGDLVIVELQVKVTSAIGNWSSFVSGVPHAGGLEIPLNAHCVSGGGGVGVRLVDTTAGTIRAVNSIASGEKLNISGLYLWRGY